MSRYIDADMLLRILETDEEYNKDNPQRVDGIIDAVQEIIAMPTADAVEVVRCKDCKHGELGINPNDNTECVYCDTLDEVWEVDDFCVMGERREDERNK